MNNLMTLVRHLFYTSTILFKYNSKPLDYSMKHNFYIRSVYKYFLILTFWPKLYQICELLGFPYPVHISSFSHCPCQKLCVKLFSGCKGHQHSCTAHFVSQSSKFIWNFWHYEVIRIFVESRLKTVVWNALQSAYFY